MRRKTIVTMGKIARVGVIGAFIGAALMLALPLLGFAHLRRVSRDAELGRQSPPDTP